MAQIVHGQCANGGGGAGAGASSPPETQAFPTLRPWPPSRQLVPVNGNNIDLPVDYPSDNVVHPCQDCPVEAAFPASWDSTGLSSSSPKSTVTSSPYSAVTSSRSSLLPFSYGVACPSFPPKLAVPLPSLRNFAFTVATLVILYYCVSIATLGHVRWIDMMSITWCYCWHDTNAAPTATGAKDVVSATWCRCWDPRYDLVIGIVTASLGVLMWPPVLRYISDVLVSSIILILESGLNRKSVTVVSLLGSLLLALVFGGIHIPSDRSLAMTRDTEIKMLINYTHSHDRVLLSISHKTHGSVVKGGCIINADLRLTAGNADGSGLDQKALPHWTSDQSSNQSAEDYDENREMLINYTHSHDRVLLSISHKTHGNVGKGDGIINADLRLTAGNTDGSGLDQKALPHWTSNQSSNQSAEHYEDKREMQKQNGPGKPHLSAHKTNKTVVVSSIAVASALVVVCCTCIAAFLWYKCLTRVQQNQPQVQLEIRGVSGPMRLQFNELAAATNNFADENKLGQGGFGPVYRGFLRDLNRHVAVKMLSAETSSQGQKEFHAEVEVLAQLRHRNIVELVGWCDSNEGFLLVYELMAEGSLDQHLHNPVRILSWQQRYKIILDLGAALFYLHRCCDKCIVHGDIKPQNVMLDASYNAKLGDFGTARLIEHGADPRTTEIIAGTRGYIDPEFVNNQLRCPEADIYSFGVALLEIASGKRPAPRQPNEAPALPVRVRNLYDRGMILHAADGKLSGAFDQQQMERVLFTGLWCAHQDLSQRPSIEQAMDVLRCVDGTLPVLPATHDPQQVRFLEELAYRDLTGEGASVDVVAASTCYLTSQDTAYLLAE